jgi:hypothetical protein
MEGEEKGFGVLQIWRNLVWMIFNQEKEFKQIEPKWKSNVNSNT